MSVVIVEADLVALLERTDATVVGERRVVGIPAGTLGTVLTVHGDPAHPTSFEVEFLLDEGVFAVATIPEAGVVPGHAKDS